MPARIAFYETVMRKKLLLIRQDCMGSCEPGNGDAEWRTAYVIEPDPMTEYDRTRFSAMLPADPNLEILACGTAPFNANLHELPDTGLINGLKRVIGKDLSLDVIG